MSKKNNAKKEIESIKFEDLIFAYDGANPVLENVNFEFPMNQFVWIRAGHVGAGRSTLLQILAGLQVINNGKYLLNDKNIVDMSFEEFLPYRLSIGYTFDLGGLLHNKTLFENLMLPLMYHKTLRYKEAENLVNLYMEKMGIIEHKNEQPSAVRGGVKKITCLIRPLLMKPQLLLLDEPSLGLGQEVILKYFDLVHELRNKGYARHVYISTLDEKLMSLVAHTELLIDGCLIHSPYEQGLKKVVHL